MNSFIPWIGGKKLLRKEILKRFPEDMPTRYIEVFGGAGWVLFAKERSSKQLEVFNDINGDLINLYRCIKYHPDEVRKECKYLLDSREQFFDFKDQLDHRGLTDIQRAARYMYLIRISFGSNGDSFCTNVKNINYAVDRLDEVSERLLRVVIENRNYEDLIKTYDRAGALFYADPPYYKTEGYYGKVFQKEDHYTLRDLLASIKGKFILSYVDCKFIRELYSDFYIEAIERTHSLTSSSQKYRELIIRNFQEK